MGPKASLTFEMRRRRSNLRPLAFLTIFLAVLLVSLAVALSVWFGSYIRSENFRAMIAERTGEAFDASAGFSPLRWTGASAYVESTTFQGAPSAALKKLEARELRAQMNWRAAFSGSWRVEDITVTHLDGEWQRPGTKRISQPSSPRSFSNIPSVVASLLPKNFEIGVLNVSNANLRFEGEQIAGTSLIVKPDGTGWVFQGKGGRFTSPWTPELLITDFRAREQGRNFFLTQGNLRLGPNGKILLSGESASGGKLQVSWEGISSSDVLSREWAGRMEGILSGSGTLASPDVCKGSITLRDGHLENIAMLGTIADFTKNPAFRRMPLQEVRADFAWENRKWNISKFSAESKGLLRIEGSAVIGMDRRIAGNLQIGVTSQTLQWLPGARERVFTIARDGYLWTDLRVGGTMDQPTENLSERLAAAMGGEIIERGTELIKKVPNTAVEGVKSVLDILRPFAP